MSGLGIVQTDKNANFDLRMATLLYDSLKANGLLQSAKSKPKSWSSDFKVLRCHFDEKDIEHTLLWYRSHLNEKYAPKVYSARKFREKYTAIKEAMKRLSTTSPAEVEITDKAKKLQKQMMLNWPGEQKNVELAFIQLNLNFCQSFSRRLSQVKKNLEVEYNKTKAMQLLLNDGFKTSAKRLLLRVIHLHHCHSTPADMTVWWCEYINKKAWMWEDYHGDIMKDVLSDTNPKFNKAMAQIIADEFGDGVQWGKIRQLISKEK